MREMVNVVKIALQLAPGLCVLCGTESEFYQSWFKIGSPEHLTYDGAMFHVEKMSAGEEHDGGVTHITVRWIQTYGLVEE